MTGCAAPERRSDGAPQTERIETVPVSVGETLRLARTGRIAGGQSAPALLLCEERLREHGYLG